MKKWLWFIIGFFVLLLILVGVFFFSLTSGKVISAMLYIDEGAVEVDSGAGWKVAIDEMELDVNDKVRTLEGKATIAFYEGEIIRLEPNTQVSIKELSEQKVTVSQDSGSTWSRLTKLGGVAEGGQVVVSESTYNKVKDKLASEKLEARKLEPVKVKGKAEPITIYEIRKKLKE